MGGGGGGGIRAGGGGGGDKSRVSYGVWGDKPKKVFALYPTLIEHEWMG